LGIDQIIVQQHSVIRSYLFIQYAQVYTFLQAVMHVNAAQC